MTTYLGLGSNLGDRRGHLARGVSALAAAGLRDVRVSPVVETPALLPERASSGWNLPFLNLVLSAVTDLSPDDLLALARRIQDELGGSHESRWAPRALDIDILLVDDLVQRGGQLVLPHPFMHQRAFVMVPLAHLGPWLRLPGQPEHTVLELAHALPQHLPLWMGIVNITPDSFSDGGLYTEWDAVEGQVQAMLEAGVHYVDLGAESTRPGATPLTPDQEWQRLQPVLGGVLALFRGLPLPPRVSVDTRHPRTAARALEAGAHMINDVSGLTDPEMIAVAAGSDAEWVAMHSLSVPAAGDIRLAEDCDAPAEVERWLEQQIARWDSAGLDLRRLMFDPGIGFGKTSLQSLQLLRGVRRFARHGVRVLVGHSRKSFFKDFSGRSAGDRDLETIGASLKLCEQGVDVLRVHDVPGHVRAFNAWAHLQG